MPPKADNQGKRWSKEDIAKIETMLEEESSHDDIAKELKRTTNSIQPHICALASKMLDDNKDMDEVTEFTGLSKEVIEKYIKAKQKKETKKVEAKKENAKKSKKTNSKESESDSESEFDEWEKQVISLLTEIRDSLKNKKFSFDEE